MTDPIRVAIIGVGQIATAQHLPAIARSPAFELAFLVDPHHQTASAAPCFQSLEEALTSGLPFDAAVLTTSPQVRFGLCQKLLKVAPAILLEKPPFSSLSEARMVSTEAKTLGVNLFAAWHARFAPALDLARVWVAEHVVKRGQIEWRENANKWHPGQDWLWRAGGLGVFDPGINALSILTSLFPETWTVKAPHFKTSARSQTPSVADFQLLSKEAEIAAHFEFHDTDDDIWTITLEAANGDIMKLSDGGARIFINGVELSVEASNEYDNVYNRFHELIRTGRTDFDVSPLELTADTFLLARNSILTERAS